MPRISDIMAALESWAPAGTQQSYDNVGLQVGDAGTEVTRCVIALELTPPVVEEAVACGAQLIITHHPLIFRPLKALTSADWHGALILRLAREGISLYCIHTNLDAAQGGVSFALGEQLGLENLRFLRPTAPEADAYAEAAYGAYPTEQPSPLVGMGAVGTLPEPETLSAFIQRAATALGTDSIRYVGDLDKPVRTAAVCGGSGSDLIRDAMRAGADVFLTADITYHRFFEVLDVHGSPLMALVDVMHYETEACTQRLLVDWLSERFPDAQWRSTQTRTSPIATFIPDRRPGV